MERRNCCEVILEMIKEIPEEEAGLIDELNKDLEDASFKAPELTIQWDRTMRTLMNHLPKPSKDWHWKVLSIFTTKPVEALKAEFIAIQN